MEPTEIVNLCPHAIHLIHEDGRVDTIAPSTIGPARADTEQVADGDVNGFPIVKITYHQIGGLPPPRLGIIYITSLLVAQRVRRPDVFSPGEIVRDDAGVIIGCKSLARHS